MVIKYSFFSLLLILCLSACTKIQETEIGNGLIPPVDGVVTKDTTLTVYAKNTSNIDTVKLITTDDHVLGYINDPLFGTTTAAINVQLQPDSYPFTFGTGTDFILDSVVLSLAVRGVWGETLQPLTLHVKEINNDQEFHYDDTTYHYTNTTKFAADNDVTYNGAATIDPRTLNDDFNFRTYGDSGNSALRIRLTQNFGNRLLFDYDSANEYKNDSLFRVAFKGFQIYADSSGMGNALIRTGLLSSSGSAEANTKLGIYYTYIEASGKKDTAVKYFTFNPVTSAHSNYISRNLGSSPAGNYYPSTSAVVNDGYIYLQSSPGTMATLTLDSGITRLPNWIIHRADIIMEEAAPDNVSLFDTAQAPFLFMVVKENNTLPFVTDPNKFIIPGFRPDDAGGSTDAVFSSSVLSNYTEVGGYPLRKYNANGTYISYYNFNLSRYVQGIITNKNTLYPLTLFTPYRQVYRLSKNIATTVVVSATPYNPAGIGRVRLYSGGTDTSNVHRMKLHIVYSIPH